MSFFTRRTPHDKFLSLASHLSEQLDELRQRRWARYLVCATKFANEGNRVDQEIQDQVLIHHTMRSKENFSWESLFDNGSLGVRADTTYQYFTAKVEFERYHDLARKAEEIESILRQSPPDYRKIHNLCLAIKNEKVVVNSDFRGNIQMGDLSGNNAFDNLFGGIVGLFRSIVAALFSICFTTGLHYSGETGVYLGKTAFVVDCFSWFVNSVINIITTILLPIAMLYSKHKTDSYNIVKGELSRTVDSMMHLAEMLEPSIAEQTEHTRDTGQLCTP